MKPPPKRLKKKPKQKQLRKPPLKRLKKKPKLKQLMILIRKQMPDQIPLLLRMTRKKTTIRKSRTNRITFSIVVI